MSTTSSRIFSAYPVGPALSYGTRCREWHFVAECKQDDGQVYSTVSKAFLPVRITREATAIRIYKETQCTEEPHDWW